MILQMRLAMYSSSGGYSLDNNIQELMESRFGYDFSRVRIHRDSKAAESAQSVNASAYTVGQDIVFGQGQYSPSTTTGRQLLAHELVHVIQQNRMISPVLIQRQPKRKTMTPKEAREKREECDRGCGDCRQRAWQL